MSINDKKAADLKVLGYSGTIEEMEVKFLEAAGITKGQYNDMWQAYLAGQTGVELPLPGEWKKYLSGLGYSGAINDQVDAAVDADALYASGPSYLEQATFTAANQTFADAQVLDTTTEGVEAGSLTVWNTDNPDPAFEILNNKMRLHNTSGLGNRDDNAVRTTNTYDRTLGTMMMVTVDQSADTPDNYAAGWSPSPVATPLLGERLMHYPTTLSYRNSYTGALLALAHSQDSTEEKSFAIMLGGYNSSGEPYRTGETKADYTYGTQMWVKGGTTFPTWQLFYASSQTNTSTLYAYPVGCQTDPNEWVDVWNFSVPDYDFSDMLVHSALDMFVDSNGTAIGSHTPDVGPVWSQNDGTWDIQSNKASVATDTGEPELYRDTGKSDVLCECVFQMANAASYSGPTVRQSALDDNWWMQYRPGFNDIRLLEVGAGSTVRANVFVTINTATDYKASMYARGQYIYCINNDANTFYYASATRNQTSTTHGFRASDTGTDVSWHRVCPLGKDDEYVELEDY